LHSGVRAVDTMTASGMSASHVFGLDRVPSAG
jgi:hypothetical protein